MARSLRIQYPGPFYHVTSRGNERKAVSMSLLQREETSSNRIAILCDGGFSESSPGMLNKQHKDKKLGELVLKITRKLTLSNV